MEVFIDVYAVESGQIVLKQTSTDSRFRYDWRHNSSYDNSTVWSGPGNRGQGIYIDRLALDTGRLLQGDLPQPSPCGMKDYIVMGFELRRGAWDKHYVCCSNCGGICCDSYAVRPNLRDPGNDTWWEDHYLVPDPAFALPNRYNEEKGLTPNPVTKFRTHDMRIVPLYPAVGDTVSILATVHNFSLVPLSGAVGVRFFAYGTPEGCDEIWVPLVNTDSDSIAYTDAAGIPARASETLEFRWVYDGSYLPETPKIYAVIDPGSITQIHTNNDKGWVPLYVPGDPGCQPTAVEPQQLPPAYVLHQNFPNPFNPSTRFAFSLPRAGRTKLVIYDLAGRHVKTLVDADLPAGVHTLQWLGRNERGVRVASGVYVYRITSGDSVETRKLVLLK